MNKLILSAACCLALFTIYQWHRPALPLLMTSTPVAVEPGIRENQPNQSTAATATTGAHSFPADLASGLIGTLPNGMPDDPADNVFHIRIPAIPPGSRAYLQYEVFGVSDQAGIAKSINDERARGGQVVKLQNEWSTQYEPIPLSALHTGDNVVRFSMPASATFHYRIRKLSIRFDQEPATAAAIQLQGDTLHAFQDQVYLSGQIIQPFDRECHVTSLTLQLGHQQIVANRGVFEAIVPLSIIQNAANTLKVVLPGGQQLEKELSHLPIDSADLVFVNPSDLRTANANYIPARGLLLSNTGIRGASIEIPAKALATSRQISIMALRDIDAPATGPELINVTRGAYAYRFLPHGTRFHAVAKITLPYDSSLIPEGYTAADIRTYYFDEQTKSWQDLNYDTLLAKEGVVVSGTTHFTDMINGIIKVPESPQTQGYTPTSIKDLKPANPSEGINMLNIPVASQTGGVSLGLDIKLPGGRQNMQPQLRFQYSSEGSNSWMGLNWNLSVSTIGLDTRRGAPRYDASQETENYTLNGEMLGPIARKTGYDSRTAEKRFYPRVEGSFQKIVRHGNSPANYWWEVTDKSGVSHYYGGRPGGVDNNAVLRDGANNIAQWALVETRDLNGNFVRYHYQQVADPGIAGGTLPGIQLYLSTITYTGFNNTEGAYTVTFIRDRQLGEVRRKDIDISARLGFKMVTADLLRRVEIRHKGSPVRSYELQYQEGAFYKTLLKSVSEIDASGKVFYTNELNYYDDVHVAAGYEPFHAAEDWSPGYDGLKADINKPLNNFTAEGTALNTTKASNTTRGLAITVGFDNGEPDKSLTVGGNFSSNNSKTEGLVALVDINGDGLPDKVFKKGGQLQYRPNLGLAGRGFGSPAPIIGIGNFGASRSGTQSTGFEANASIFFYSNISSSTTTTTTHYFSDFNGDGLIDIASNGVVYFNRRGPDGNPVFLPESGGTPAPITGGANVSPVFFAPDKTLEAQQEKDYPLQDIVRMWQAPHSGTIQINAPVQLVDPGIANPKRDGVIVSIQQGSQILWSSTIAATDFGIKVPVIGTRPVTKGEKLYFRVQSVKDGDDDLVNWDPVIDYASGINPNYDANNRPSAHYRASEDFVLHHSQGTKAGKEGDIRFDGLFTKGITSDTVRLKIVIESGGVSKIVRDTAYPGNSIVNNERINLHDQSFAVLANDRIRFMLESDSYIDRVALQWTPTFIFTRFSDNSPAQDANGVPTIQVFASPSNAAFHEWLRAAPVVTTQQKDTVDLRPLLIGPPGLNGRVTFTIKKKNEILFKRQLQLAGGIFSNAADTIPFVREPNDSLYCDFHITDRALATGLQTAAVVIRFHSYYLDINGDTVRTIRADTLAANVYTEPAESYLGPLFRGWGHFSYKGTPGLAPLDEGKLNTNAYGNYPTDPYQYTNPDALNGLLNPANTEFIPLYANIEKNNWTGFDSSVFVTPSQMSSARLWMHDITVDSIMSGGGIQMVNKVTESKVRSSGLGASYFASASKNDSKSNTTNVLDVFDMNGDQHPDVLHRNSIQYTTPGGGLEGTYRTHNLNAATYSGHSEGITMGGSLPPSNAKNTNTQQSQNAIATASGTLGISLSASSGTNDDEAMATWMDINGDGLSDKVYNNGYVQLNLGYSFLPAENWGGGEIEKNRTEDFNSGAGFNIVNGSFQGGFSVQQNDGTASVSYADVNGDGLTDKLRRGNGTVSVQLNTGNGFAPAINWSGLTDIRNSRSTGESINGAFTIPFTPKIIPIKICVNPQWSRGDGISRDNFQVQDIDGDGFGDILRSSNDGQLLVQRSTIDRTNLLRAIKRPMGSTMTLDYERTGNNYELPQNKWVLKRVQVTDGVRGDGVDTTRTVFEYAGGHYDRDERQFYGFEKVTTLQLNTAGSDSVYRRQVQTFHNKDYYHKGLLKSEWTEDAAGRKYIQTDYQYDLRKVSDTVMFPALVKTTKRYFEGNAVASVVTSTEMDYDQLGNIISINDLGDGSQQDILMATVQYHNRDAQYLKSTPSSIEVRTANGLIRKRETSINAQGDITQIRLYLTDDSIATYDLEYTPEGNLRKLTRPLNYKNAAADRLWYEYTYDTEVQTYVTKVKDAYGYESSSTYDVRFGAITGTVSMQKEPMRYTLDAKGRTTSITGPYEIASGKPYTIAFEYFDGDSIPYAITRHYDPEYNADISIYTFMDGLGRPVQVKKQASLFKGTNRSDELQMIVSGKTVFDAFGRTIANYYPTTETIGPNNNKLSLTQGLITSHHQYDVMDRQVRVTLADGATAHTVYALANGFLSVKETDALGNVKETWSDVKGRKRQLTMYDGPGKAIVTKYAYNAMSELLKVTDHKNNVISYTYDKLGRQLSIQHPDAGLTTMKYDLAGNLLEKVTAQIRKEIPRGGAIKYFYDRERLTDIDYPRQYQNKVKYTYGKPGSGDRTGRLILQEDASGGQEFYYGKLGEITKTIRTVAVNNAFFTTYVSEQQFDTWARIKQMVYPDGEIVRYFYNRGGTLDSMTGAKTGRVYKYVDRLGYDEFEQRIYLRYGNGAENFYTYDNQRRRLVKLKANTDSGRTFLDMEYSYDPVSNITALRNNVAAQAGKMGGAVMHKYRYDNLYRLIGAQGVYSGNDASMGYQLNMEYDELYNITRKQVTSYDRTRSYDNSYAYTGNAPHQPTSIGTTNYRYDLNGNLLGDAGRKYFWDEENRLQAVMDARKLSRYTYDAGGERVIKSSGGIWGTWLNGAAAGFINHDSNYTVYVSPYLVCRRTGFTKHYYIENQRITSKIGLGRFNNISFAMPAITAGGINYLHRQGQITRDRYAYYATLGISPGPPTDKYFYALPYNSGIAAPVIVDSTASSIPPGWPGNTTQPPSGPPTYVKPIPGNDSVRAGYGFVGTGHFLEQYQYFYHPDHLGSSSYITNIIGEVTQHQEYMPYGETFIEEHQNHKQPYLFNAKERDDETGLYYYGARYYDPWTSIWISVDPLMDHPEQIEKSPYAYTWNNPIKYTDRDGKQPYFPMERAIAIAAGTSAADGPFPAGEIIGVVVIGTAAAINYGPPVWEGIKDFITDIHQPDKSESILLSSPPIPTPESLPWDKGQSPGADWKWKGKGTPESGRGNWVNDETGQKLHPDLDHGPPKGKHWGLTQPNGEKVDIFPPKEAKPEETPKNPPPERWRVSSTLMRFIRRSGTICNFTMR